MEQSSPRPAFPSGSHVHCVGIGGVGVSALAQWLLAQGTKVSGSDRAETDLLAILQTLGVAITVDPNGSPLPRDVDTLVYSDAVPADDPARREAEAKGIPQYSYAEALGMLSAPYETVAISGSHGKSTTTALVTLILEAAGYDPTAVIGTRVPALGNRNFRPGSGEVAVIEADEYRGHCLTLTPAVAVVTTTDYDHVDAFPTPASYIEMFRQFVQRTAKNGMVVLRASDLSTPVLSGVVERGTLATFDIVPEPAEGNLPSFTGVDVTFRATPPVLREGRQIFTVFHRGSEYGTFALPFPGEHFVLDALAALAAVSPWDVPREVIQEVFAGFTGTWRRFEHVGVLDGNPVISDYAHHPTELRAVLRATRQWYPDRRILLAFQPHQRSRTKAFARDFLDALTGADALILSEIYDVAGREDPNDTTSAKDWVPVLAQRGMKVVYAPTLEETEALIRSTLAPNDVVLVVGAGSIDRVARKLVAA